ncbi:nucleoside triphosphate pyrophosphohydrolase [Thalassotalea mangrovi]|uniref:Nucleoside triphosphate pyrophosphohydrolase n=1 Tax=Thalassotalea mangrovi TaxID=2572245 RepID=A0A4U1B6U3_9GAMM|nr:nucleoside triphosphate pyrophosphohydrolase [Thalassotalea mangrovi]TKB46170.1 nucleoside triphosphate pyrophosphohydrolase [Thalassotalea mangrovi]
MLSAPASVEKLIWIMQRLRDPEGGCPWDLKQNFASIVPYTLEEAYEVAEAIENNDFVELEKELGDLLFQVVFYAQLGKEQALFDFDQVVSHICEKLIRRHPHVFADMNLASEAEIKANWEAEKAKERQQKAEQASLSMLADIPRSLPALSQAAKIQKRCAHVGFDWDNIHDVLEKVKEECDEISTELNAEPIDQDAVAEEIGDLLFAVVNLARHAKLDPEQTLRQANQKFTRRFQHIEQHFFDTGEDIKAASLEQLEQLWQQAKNLNG